MRLQKAQRSYGREEVLVLCVEIAVERADRILQGTRSGI
jgi:hypothetical protein